MEQLKEDVRWNYNCGLCRPQSRRTTLCPASELLLEIPPKRPDPGIYSQRQVFYGGGRPNWDSRDIRLKRIGEHSVILAEIRNHSPIIPAARVRIHCDIATEGGIGVDRRRIGTQEVFIEPSATKDVTFLIPEELEHLHLPTYISIEMAGDARTINNYGEQVVLGLRHYVEEALRGQFVVQNSGSDAAAWQLTVVSTNASAETTIVPDHVALGPGERQECFVTGVGAPMHSAPMEITILAQDSNGVLIGGITFSAGSKDA